MAARPRISGGTILLVVVLAGLLGFALWGLQAVWRMSGDTSLGVHGWIAMGLAAGLTLALGGGLMWLAFYSSRRGYDERQGDESARSDDPP
jgi:hypothetical protein